jgi:chromosome segregation ATPase
MRRLNITVVSVLGVALVAAVVVILHQSQKLTEVTKQRDTALQSLQESREALQQSQLRLSAALREPPKPTVDLKAEIEARDAAIQKLTDKLKAAQGSVTQLQQDLSDSKEENQNAAESSSQRYEEMQTKFQNRLKDMQAELNSSQAELQASHQRIASLQKVNDRLQSQNGEGTRRAAEQEHILNNLQDLDRRRESYLTSIADRYRNLTSQFRTMSGMMDSNRGRDSGGFNGQALDQIQNAISLTDNDLQHLSELNAKAFQLEKRLAKIK